MGAPTTIHVRSVRHRDKLRASGMRPIQLWVPDTRAENFLEECRRQSLLASAADAADLDLTAFMNGALNDIDGWEA